MRAPELRHRVIAIGFAGLAAIALAGAAIVLSGRPPDGPVRVDWDHTRCARCGMLVSDPAFAAQLHEPDGEVRHYDDPGCMLADLAERAKPPHAVWVHHYREERWLPLASAGFVEVPHSPMGYGLGAVEAGEVPEALDPAAGTRLALERGPSGAGP